MQSINLNYLNRYFNINSNWQDLNHNGMIEKEEVPADIWQTIDAAAEYQSEEQGKTQLSDGDVEALKKAQLGIGQSSLNPSGLRLVLPNGLILLIKRVPESALVSVGINVQSGSNDDPPGREGLAHASEHLVLLNNPKGADPNIVQVITNAGGSVNGQTGGPVTRFYATGPRQNLRTMLLNLLTRVVHWSGASAGLDKEKMVISKELLMMEKDPLFKTYIELYKLAFEDSGRRNNFGGDMATVNNISAQDLEQHLATSYVPNDLVVTVSGNVKPEKVVLMVKELTSNHPSQPAAAHALDQDERHSGFRHKILAPFQAPASFLTMGYFLPLETSAEYPAATVLRKVLINRLKERITKAQIQEIPEKVYKTNRDDLLIVAASAKAQDLVEVQQAILREIGILRSQPVSDEELSRAIAQLEWQYYNCLESVECQQDLLSRGEVIASSGFNEALFASVKKVTKEDLRQAADRYLSLRNSASIILPEQGISKDDLAKIDQAQAALESTSASAEEARAIAGSAPADDSFAGSEAMSRDPVLENTRKTLSLTLSNGIGVYLERSNRIPKISFSLHFSRKGTTASKVQIQMLLKVLEQSFPGKYKVSSWASQDEAILSFELLAEDEATALPLIKQIISGDINITEDALKAAQKAMAEHLIMDARDPFNSSLLYLQLKAGLEGRDTQATQTMIDTEVKALTPEELAGYYQELLQGKIAVASVGALSQSGQSALIGDLKNIDRQTSAAAPEKENKTIASPGRFERSWSQPFALLTMGFPEARLNSRDKAALDVVSKILWQRLLNELRLKRGLIYMLHTGNTAYAQGGLLYLLCAAKPQDMQTVEALLKDEINKLNGTAGARSLPTKAEIEAAKHLVMGTRLQELEAGLARAEMFGTQRLLGIAACENDAEIESLSAADLLKVTKKYLDPERTVAIISSPQ